MRSPAASPPARPQLNIPIHPDLKRRVEIAAERARLPVTAWVRVVLDTAARKQAA